MTHIDETRTLKVQIPVWNAKFRDEKEIMDLFTYVYEKTGLHKNVHFPMTLTHVFECSEDKYYFTLTFNISEEEYIKDRKKDLENLIELYNKIESEYFQFKKFGEIESKMLIRSR